MRFTIDSTHGLYAAADTAEQAVEVLRHHLEGLHGEPDITFLIVGPDGRRTNGTIIRWSDNPDPARTVDGLLDGIVDELTAPAARR